jgi:uncharacterized membrane protein YoaK (UPF0700 family)
MSLEKQPSVLNPVDTVLAVLLTLTAGYVDAVGFLRLQGIYVANMSGNSIAIGLHSALGDWPTVLERLLPVVSYVADLLAVRMARHIAKRLRFRRFLAACLLLESLSLILFLNVRGLNSGIVFAAVAMGIQAATITQFNGVTVHTAFVTGSLIRFAETAAEWLIATLKSDPEASRPGKDAIWFFGVWAAYVGGAVCGAGVYAYAGPRGVFGACALLIVVAIPGLIRPAETR